MDAETAIASLTPAQRAAILSAPQTPYGNIWLTCAGSTKSALVGKRLASGYGDWCTLTELGKAVRASLEQTQLKAV